MKLDFTFCITVMSDGEILDCIQLQRVVGQSEWGVTSLVDWLCGKTSSINTCITAMIKHLLSGSTYLLMRALIISRLPREHSRERGVSPASFTATIDTS